MNTPCSIAAAMLALGLLVTRSNGHLAAFIVATVVMLVVAPRLTRYVVRTTGGRVSEAEINFVLFLMFGLGGMAHASGGEPILPAYLVGMVLDGTFLRERQLVSNMMTLAFTVLTPFSHPGQDVRRSRCGGEQRGAHRACAGSQGPEEVRGGGAAHASLSIPWTRGDVHHPLDERRADLWDHLGAVRAASRGHRPQPAHGARDGCTLERVRSDTHCATVLQAEGGRPSGARPSGSGRTGSRLASGITGSRQDQLKRACAHREAPMTSETWGSSSDARRVRIDVSTAALRQPGFRSPALSPARGAENLARRNDRFAGGGASSHRGAAGSDRSAELLQDQPLCP